MVGGTGWGAVVIAAPAISSGGDIPGMGATGGGAVTGARIVPCGVVRVGVSAGPLVRVRNNVLVGRVLGVFPCGGGVKSVRVGTGVLARDASNVVGGLR